MSITYGFLADHFEGFGYKRLKPVEIDPDVSNEHEFNGIAGFRTLFGSAKRVFPTRVIYLCDSEDAILEDTAQFTWYDARAKHATRTEFRLYYTTCSCFDTARAGDLLVVCKDRGVESLTVFVARQGDSIENQLAWLLGIPKDSISQNATVTETPKDARIDYFASAILERIGIQPERPPVPDNAAMLQKILSTFGTKFPTTLRFSAFARETLPSFNVPAEPDQAIAAWLDQEEMLFRLFERHLVEIKMGDGFKSVDDFVSFSLSLHGRRKSRAGYSLENHLQYMFETCKIRFSRAAVTENRAKPDYLFPGADEYHMPSFPDIYLTMLGVKTSCKDRWRQVLSEAARIPEKHLVTLEPGITENQTSEMKSHSLRLVVPATIFDTYTPTQRKWLMSLSDFVALVIDRQKLARMT
jgi:hypothetical protein